MIIVVQKQYRNSRLCYTKQVLPKIQQIHEKRNTFAFLLSFRFLVLFFLFFSSLLKRSLMRSGMFFIFLFLFSLFRVVFILLFFIRSLPYGR